MNIFQGSGQSSPACSSAIAALWVAVHDLRSEIQHGQQTEQHDGEMSRATAEDPQCLMYLRITE
jgi:hypothetical protein